VVPKFDPYSTDSIFQCLQKTLSEGWSEEKRQAGLAYAAQFNWDVAAHKTLEIYERAVR